MVHFLVILETPPSTYTTNSNGSLNSISLYQNGTLIDFSSYARYTNLTTAQNNNANHTFNTSNILQTNINTTNASLTTAQNNNSNYFFNVRI